MRVRVVTDSGGWMVSFAELLVDELKALPTEATLEHAISSDNCDLRFILSYSRIASAAELRRSRSNIVVHGSALPKGRGWSPWSWQIATGEDTLTLTAFEATDGVDAGPIYAQRQVVLNGSELVDEWRKKQAKVTLEMCVDLAKRFPAFLKEGVPQAGDGSFYPRRRPENSKLDPDLSIRAQFNVLRVVDNERYPAYFEMWGARYKLKIEKWDDEQ